MRIIWVFQVKSSQVVKRENKSIWIWILCWSSCPVLGSISSKKFACAWLNNCNSRSLIFTSIIPIVGTPSIYGGSPKECGYSELGKLILQPVFLSLGCDESWTCVETGWGALTNEVCSINRVTCVRRYEDKILWIDNSSWDFVVCSYLDSFDSVYNVPLGNEWIPLNYVKVS